MKTSDLLNSLLRPWAKTVLASFALFGLSGCGIGLCANDEFTGCLPTNQLEPRLLFSGLSGLTFRKNDCYPVTLSAVDASGAPSTETVNASLMVSSGAVVYRSLSGCQSYDAAEEKTQFTLTAVAPSVVFFVRSDTAGFISLSSSVGGGDYLPASAQVEVQYLDFDGTKGPNSAAYAIATDPANGKVLIAGDFTSYDDLPVPGIARLNSDGTLDSSFQGVGTGFDSAVTSLAVTQTSRVIAAGSFTSYNGTSASYLARLNADGSLDPSFQMGSGFDGEVYTFALQADGKAVAVGLFTTYNGTSRPYVARLQAGGGVDPSFSLAGTGFNSYVSSVAIQTDGKILVGGNFTSYNGTNRARLARLNSDGSLDTTFTQVGTGLNGDVSVIKLQADGRAVICGTFGAYHLTSLKSMARINTDGSLDATFMLAGTGFGIFGVSTLALQSDGKVVTGGHFSDYNGTTRGRIARLNSNGTLDTTFSPSGSGFGPALYGVFAILQKPDLSLWVAGSFSTYNNVGCAYLASLSATGLLDSSIGGSGQGLNSEVNVIRAAADGSVVAGGNFTYYGTVSRPYVARFRSDGSLDASFAPTGAGLNGPLRALAIQNDGRILVGGDFTSYAGSSRPYVARLWSTGELDTTFVTAGSGLNGAVYDIEVLTDGKLLLAGSFTSYNGASRPGVVRLNSDGSLDNAFVLTGTGFSGIVSDLAVQGDGKIVAGGDYYDYNGTTRDRICRLQSNGSLDTAFAPAGDGFDARVTSVAVQSDGKILAAGWFTWYAGSTARERIARLLADGTLDAAFAQVGSGINNDVSAMALQTNGNIVVGGYFTSYNGTSRGRIARIKSDGSLDTSFAPEKQGFNSGALAVAVQADQKIVVGGGFTGFSVYTANRLARITYIGTVD